MNDKQSMMLLFANMAVITTLALVLGNRDDASMVLDGIFKAWRGVFENQLEKDIREVNEIMSPCEGEDAYRQDLQATLDETETMLREMMTILTGGTGGLF